MNFEVFETEFLLNLNNKSKNCFSLIDKNRKIIEEYLGGNGDKKIIDKFVSKINVVVLKTKKNFSFIKKVLEHPAFTNVFYNFRNSDVLIQACSTENKPAIKWLLTMDINPFIQDDNGMTALMHAAKNSNLISVVKHYITNVEYLNIVDKNSENVLFYALRNSKALLELAKSKIDINQKNENNETAFLYCCKHEIYGAAIILLTNEHIDVNYIDNDGRSAAMYLAEKGRHIELRALRKRHCDINYMNAKLESPLSILIKNLYSIESSTNEDLYKRYLNTIAALLDLGCDFNVPVDEDENTAIMVFIIVKDFKTLEYVLKLFSNADLTKKNKGGENATSLYAKSSAKGKCKSIVDVPTFDYNYVDGNNNNTLLMLACINQPTLVNRIVHFNLDSINCVNSKYESALILATRTKNISTVNELLRFEVLVNQQDYLGNTALYYAVEMNIMPVIINLVNKGADPNIKNNEGKSPLDLAHENDNKTVINILTNNPKSSSSPSSSTPPSYSQSSSSTPPPYSKTSSTSPSPYPPSSSTSPSPYPPSSSTSPSPYPSSSSTSPSPYPQSSSTSPSPYPQSSSTSPSPYPQSSSTSSSLAPPSYEECIKNDSKCESGVTENKKYSDSGVTENKKYSDIEEYLYPWITNNYPQFEMKYNYEIAAGKVFRDAQSDKKSTYKDDTISSLEGFIIADILIELISIPIDILF